jgi:O-acetyl-ADP-ribose deacetylase (regulator of RNase III)
MEHWYGERVLRLVQGDITKQHVDAIVNAANKTLLGGGGVDGAIHRAAGPELLEACRRVRERVLKGAYVATGQPVLTRGYRLPAKYVLHVVGPICGVDEHPEKHLANAYGNCLRLAARATDPPIESIAFPSISTGAFGCPVEWAAKIAVSTIRAFLTGDLDTQDELDDLSMLADPDLVISAAPSRENKAGYRGGRHGKDAAGVGHGGREGGRTAGCIREVRMVLFSTNDYDVYARALAQLEQKN